MPMIEEQNWGIRMNMWDTERALLKSLLVSAVCPAGRESIRTLPGKREFILSEVVNGAVKYACGEAGDVEYKDFRFQKEAFIQEINDYLWRALFSSKKVSPRIKKIMFGLCEPYPMHVSCSLRAIINNDLYTHFNGEYKDAILPSCKDLDEFHINGREIEWVLRQSYNAFVSSERDNTHGIGEAMKEFVRKDLEFIDKIYKH
jgi:hypothetical protein